MHPLIYLLLLPIVMSCSNTKKSQSTTNVLNGTWIPVQQELAGKVLPAAAFEKQKLVINDREYIFTAESVDKGEVTFSNGKMDIYGKEGVNSGKHFMAIYKLENGQLSICYNLKGDSYPEAFDTKGKGLLFLAVFRKG